MYNPEYSGSQNNYMGLPNCDTTQQCNSVIIPFTAVGILPENFSYNCSSQISISLSTENLSIYKALVQYPLSFGNSEYNSIQNYNDYNGIREPRKGYSKRRQEYDQYRAQQYNGYNSCQPIVKKCSNYVTTEVGEVRIGGILPYRIAINGLQTDSLIIDQSLQNLVNTDNNLWASFDGYIRIAEGNNNYITIGYVPANTIIDSSVLSVTNQDLQVTSIYKEPCSTGVRVTLQGSILIRYNLPV